MRLLGLIATIVGLNSIRPNVAASQEQAGSVDLQRLQFYVGSWSEAGQMRDDPSRPFQAIAGGEICKWSAGGYAVVCEEHTGGPGGGWDGVYILSYDAAGQQYHVYGTERPGNSVHAVGRLDGHRWTWVTDPAPDGSRVRYTFAPGDAGSRTLIVELGVGDRWSDIVNLTYSPRH